MKRLDARKDEDIDYSELPELDKAFFRDARVVILPTKKPVALRPDADVLKWMKAQARATEPD